AIFERDGDRQGLWHDAPNRPRVVSAKRTIPPIKGDLHISPRAIPTNIGGQQARLCGPHDQAFDFESGWRDWCQRLILDDFDCAIKHLRRLLETALAEPYLGQCS